VSVGDNIITISLYHLISLDPPMVGIGVRGNRYSHSLLKEIGDFCLNIPSKDMVKATNGCGTVSGRDVNKFEEFGLTAEPGVKITSKTITECPLSLECKITDVLRPAKGSHDWFVGEVVHASCEKDYVPQDALLYWAGKYRDIGGTVMEK
jgi:flavin reductase (DIM6/NTAB) family NADH-FMN oxidoreductase RutF